MRIRPRHYAYLKISEGCDRLCTFCAIPQMRGKHVTKPVEEVVREAKELIAERTRFRGGVLAALSKLMPVTEPPP